MQWIGLHLAIVIIYRINLCDPKLVQWCNKEGLGCLSEGFGEFCKQLGRLKALLVYATFPLWT